MEGSGQEQAGLPDKVLLCHICLAPPTYPVATLCGHLFCWPCLYRWLENRPKPCPVCRTMLRKDINIAPIFGTDEANNPSPDPEYNRIVHANLIPPRPRPPHWFTLNASGHLTSASVCERVLNEHRAWIREHARSRIRQAETEFQDTQLHRMNTMQAGMQASLDSMELELNQTARSRMELMQEVLDLRTRTDELVRQAAQTERRRLEERNALITGFGFALDEHFARLQGLNEHFARSVAQTLNDHFM